MPDWMHPYKQNLSRVFSVFSGQKDRKPLDQPGFLVEKLGRDLHQEILVQLR